jgi:regulator of protease activity HflC (stomatin/prohibitin superfamily)
MKKLFNLVMFAIIAMTVTSCGYEKIDAGNAGIKVNLYGNEKGVDNVVEVTGAQWYNPFTTEIVEFPTFVQNIVWTADEREGSENNEELRLTTKNGLIVRIDVSMNYRVETPHVVQMYKKYRKPLPEISRTVLRNFVRDGYNTAAAAFTAEEIYADRIHFQNIADSLIRQELEPEGFTVEKLVLINDIRLPKSIKESIERKIAAKQIALQKESELQQTRADAAKRIADAKGLAESKRILADADRYVYEQKQRSLTSLIVQQQFVEKWNGNYGTGNVFGAGPVLYKQIK